MTTVRKIETLRQLIDEGEKLPIEDSSDAQFKAWKNDVECVLIRIFGPESTELHHFRELDLFFHAIIMTLGSDYSREDLETFRRDMQVALSSLRRYVRELEAEDNGGEMGEFEYDIAQICRNGPPFRHRLGVIRAGVRIIVANAVNRL